MAEEELLDSVGFHQKKISCHVNCKHSLLKLGTQSVSVQVVLQLVAVRTWNHCFRGGYFTAVPLI